MAKKRKANLIAKQSAADNCASAASDMQHTIDVPPIETTNICPMESDSKAPAKKKAKQKKKSMSKPSTAWVEEIVEDTTFNIEQCRNPSEQDEHWELRRAFLEKNQHLLPRDELICLAQVYINVQLLGCRYPPETMKKIDELAEGLGQDYHRSRALMLKRTFISASVAAASKVRREDPITAANIDTGSSDQATHVYQGIIPSFMLNCLRNDLIILNNDFPQTMNMFNRLNTRVKINASFLPKGQGMYEGFVELSGITLTKAKATESKIAMRMATGAALKIFSQYCYSLRRKKQATELDGIEVIPKTDAEKQDNHEEPKQLNTDNVGFKLLAKLGWSGGCLGVRGDGIVDPVSVEQKFGRNGLGLKAATEGKLNLAMIKKKLMDLSNGKIEDHHIVFSNEYSKEDRKQIHMLAMGMKLKSQSYGKDSNGTRQLVVSRKQLRPREMLRKILFEKDPAFCEMYEVIPPAEQA